MPPERTGERGYVSQVLGQGRRAAPDDTRAEALRNSDFRRIYEPKRGMVDASQDFFRRRSHSAAESTRSGEPRPSRQRVSVAIPPRLPLDMDDRDLAAPAGQLRAASAQASPRTRPAGEDPSSGRRRARSVGRDLPTICSSSKRQPEFRPETAEVRRPGPELEHQRLAPLGDPVAHASFTRKRPSGSRFKSICPRRSGT
jgi:hypothetical protein